MKKLLLTSLTVLMVISVHSEELDFQKSSPKSSFTMQRFSEITWTSIHNGNRSDEKNIQIQANYVGQMSNFLVLSNFNFQIPELAYINGVSLTIERSAIGIGQAIKDLDIRIIDNETMIGANKKKREVWSNSEEIVTYGGVHDNWRIDLSPQQINRSDFGIAIAVKLDGGGVLPKALIDHVELTIHYSTALPVKMLSFSADLLTQSIVQLKWTTASEINNDYFEVQKSNDGSTWKGIGRVSGYGNTTQVKSYEFTDHLESSDWTYYRLKQVDFNGAFEYSFIEAVKGRQIVLIKNVYPNPSRGAITIEIADEARMVSIYDSRGRMIIKEQLNGEGRSSFNLSNAQKGVGFIKVETDNGDISIEKFIYE